MPYLHRFIAFNSDKPCFILPIFKARLGANQDLIQEIDSVNNISDFAEYMALESEIAIFPNEYIEKNIGEKAIWAFIDDLDQVQFGEINEFVSRAQTYLRREGTQTYPMMAAELVQFCRSIDAFPDIMRSAFEYLRGFGAISADYWLDNTVLLPEVKRDVLDIASPEEIRNSFDVFIKTYGDRSHIFVKGIKVDKIARLKNWQKAAAVFNIKHYTLHQVEAKNINQTSLSPDWVIVGLGGVSRFVLNRSPFARFLRPTSTIDALVSGTGLIGSANHSAPQFTVKSVRPTVMAVVGSNAQDVKRVSTFIRENSIQEYDQHFINVRPIGYGTPNPSKINPFEINQMLGNRAAIWIVAAHRQKKIGSHWMSISASSVASRFVRAASLALIDCMYSRFGQDTIETAKRGSKVGIVGAARFDASGSVKSNVFNVLGSMLCEDAPLSSAAEIVVFWPYSTNDLEDLLVCQLGRHHYQVKLLGRSTKYKSPDVVGFALGVKRGRYNLQSFNDFVVSLMHLYGWDYEDVSADLILFEKENEKVTFRLSVEQKDFESYVAQSVNNDEHLYIVTNKSIRSATAILAAANKWQLLHYTDLYQNFFD